MDFNIFSNEGSLYRAAEWVTRLVYINFLWILFTIIGLGVFGIMPASLASFEVIRQFLSGKDNVKVFSLFWGTYKENFIKINLIGLIMFVIGFILIIDLRYFQGSNKITYQIIKYAFYILLFLYIMDFIYIFPIYSKYNIKKFYIIKNALFFVFLTPLETLQIVLGMAAVLIFFRFLPSLLPFLGISLPLLLVAWISSKAIFKVEEKIRNK